MKYTFTRKQIVNAFNNKILDDDNFLTYLLSTTSKDRPINQKSLDKDIWTVLPKLDCKHLKNRVIKNELGWLCLDCVTYIDKDMITNLDKK